MSKRARAWLIASAAFLLFLLLAWVLGATLGMTGLKLWILRGGLAVLGVVAGVLLYLFFRPRPGEPPPQKDEMDVILATAQERLAGSRAAPTSRVAKLPVVLVMGPPGSTKTTVVTQSGLDPELLAGAVKRADATVPTEAINVWYGQGTVFLEAGGAVTEDAARWARLTRLVQPSRLAAVFSRGEQAPRVAVVCYGCDELQKPGAGEAVPAAAERLRARLAELAQQLGVRLPVYVLFTKADRLPYFDDYVRSFGRDEAQQVLGATLAAATADGQGTYAEREARRVGQAFGALVHSLSLRRLEVLPRETRDEVRAGAYEFPRELRKVADLTTRFLVDLCRPSQLGVSPFLRGFYFTGVRAVYLQDSAAVAPAAPAPGSGGGMDATAVFNPRLLQQQMQQAAQAQAGTRKVPEWMFLKRLFPEVVLADRAAKAVTAGGTRIHLLRRTLLGAAAIVCLIAATGFTVSWATNRGLRRDTVAAARGVEALASPGAELAPAADLARLDSLRAQLARLRDYDRNGSPMRMRWGLYSGDLLLPAARRIYFDRLARLLWSRTDEDLRAWLRALPEAPTEASEYGATYDALKAHLVMTSYPDSSRSDFLAPVLMRFWAQGQQPDSARSALAERQFAFYAAELPFGNPYDAAANDATIERTRAFLGRFANTDRFYNAMISEASQATPAVQFNRTFPGSESALRNDHEVPGAFTRPGWGRVQASLANVDRLFSRETWVVGERAVSPRDRAKLVDELRSRYIADYTNAWEQYLTAWSLPGFGGVSGAARSLDRLASNQSPLLQMLALASRHTALDTAKAADTAQVAQATTPVDSAFQPVHLVTPPGVTDSYINDTNSQYMSALSGLQAALNQAKDAQGPEQQQALQTAGQSADQAELAVRQMAQAFSVAGEARTVGTAVQRLLRAPIAAVKAVIGAAPAAGLNGSGQSFCRAFSALQSMYPFNPGASAEASADDVSAMLQPGSGALWGFVDGSLQGLVVRQGPRYGAAIGATPRPNPAFIAFVNRAADIADAFYDAAGEGPKLGFLIQPQLTPEVPELTLSVEGRTERFTRTNTGVRSFDWNPSRAAPSRIVARVGGSEVTVAEASGAWSPFRLLQQGQWQSAGGSRYRVLFRVPGLTSTLTLVVQLAAPAPVLDVHYLDGLNCVSRIVR